MTDEYRTVNADLSAALITVGARLRAMETSDGVTIEFVFDADTDGRLVSDVVTEWSQGALMVDASTLSKNIKRVYKQVRDRKREFENSRKERA